MKRVFVMLLTCFAAQADSPLKVGQHLPCQGNWIWQQGRVVLGWPFVAFDFSSQGDEADIAFAKSVEDGKAEVLINAITKAMKSGALSSSAVELAGTAVTLNPVLREVEQKLEGDQLPHLTFLLVGPKDFEDGTRDFLQSHGSVFDFIPYEQQACAPPPELSHATHSEVTSGEAPAASIH